MQSTDFKWFVDNMPALFAKYGPCFVAIKDKTVLGKYSSYNAAVEETARTEPLGTFIVQQCGADESAYTNYISSFDFCS